MTVQSACPTLRKDTVKGCDEPDVGVWVEVVAGAVGVVPVTLGVDVWLGVVGKLT